MTPIFSHRSSVPLSTTNYRRFRLYIREDFSGCCAYCLLPEVLAGGEENFELDHFKPQSLFSHLVHSYENLYYSCHACNNIKRNSWPTKQLLDQGYRFIDTCREDFSTHFKLSGGRWQPISRPGEYSEHRLRLNRTHLVKLRQIVAELLEILDEQPIDWNVLTAPQIAPIEGRLPT